jgi:hypothetical protein
MHRNLRGLNIDAFIKKHAGLMHPRLKLILELTSLLKTTNNMIQRNIFRPHIEGQPKVAGKDSATHASQKSGDKTGSSMESEEVNKPMVTSSQSYSKNWFT